MFLGRVAQADGQPGACGEMDESFSLVIFVYGLAFIRVWARPVPC
jgi:hypothetical protein